MSGLGQAKAQAPLSACTRASTAPGTTDGSSANSIPTAVHDQPKASTPGSTTHCLNRAHHRRRQQQRELWKNSTSPRSAPSNRQSRSACDIEINTQPASSSTPPAKSTSQPAKNKAGEPNKSFGSPAQSGEGGIRTPEPGYPDYTDSSRAPSATRTPLRKITNHPCPRRAGMVAGRAHPGTPSRSLFGRPIEGPANTHSRQIPQSSPPHSPRTTRQYPPAITRPNPALAHPAANQTQHPADAAPNADPPPHPQPRSQPPRPRSRRSANARSSKPA